MKDKEDTMDLQFDILNKKIDNIDDKLEMVIYKFNKIFDRFVGLVSRLDKTVDDIEDKLNKCIDKVDNIINYTYLDSNNIGNGNSIDNIY